MYLLIDCDNFFVSCEKAFQPRLKNRPVIVLSNNDGCVVSRSYEAKALGIPMCAPYFKIEKMFKAAGGIALSSNYELYADMSKRVMRLIESYFGKIEIYSIDEAFTEVDRPRKPAAHNPDDSQCRHETDRHFSFRRRRSHQNPLQNCRRSRQKANCRQNLHFDRTGRYRHRASEA